MLFHSQIFLFAFLPACLIAWYAIPSTFSVLRNVVLIAFSIAFYAYWDPRLAPLLVASVLLNWAFALAISHHRHKPNQQRRFLAVGVGANLAILAGFKYADFVVGSVAALGTFDYVALDIVLPLGISFFTFQQISYLVDLRRYQLQPYSLREFALYVCFFPQLIAGPIVRHDELVHQFSNDPKREAWAERLGRGASLLTLGMVKKVFIADELAKLSDPLFARLAAGTALSLDEAWAATLGFGMQLYFDFSAYSDMAIGIALMFGLSLPVNFNSPYSARSLQDFWRRWHMTLSRFLRDYLYFSLGGSRQALPLTLCALMMTMLLGGLWHGAAWTFVAWGGAHGLGLCANHLFAKTGLRLPVTFAWPLTFGFVMLCWVLFRAEDFSSAALMYQSLFGLGAAVSDGEYVEDLWVLWPALGVALFAPTSQRCCLKIVRPKISIAALVGLALFVVALTVGGWKQEEFIYFQF